MNSEDDPPKGGGCPIRKPTDQRLLAAPRGFSQRATSFIASWCQGIHRMPFSCSFSKAERIPSGMRPTPPTMQQPHATAFHRSRAATSAGHSGAPTRQRAPEPLSTSRNAEVHGKAYLLAGQTSHLAPPGDATKPIFTLTKNPYHRRACAQPSQTLRAASARPNRAKPCSVQDPPGQPFGPKPSRPAAARAEASHAKPPGLPRPRRRWR